MYLGVNFTLFLEKEKIDPGLNFKVFIFLKVLLFKSIYFLNLKFFEGFLLF